jgi:hypothetical protein
MVLDSTPAVFGQPKMDVLYDAGRDVYYQKPALRGWMHVVWFGASLVLGGCSWHACTGQCG